MLSVQKSRPLQTSRDDSSCGHHETVQSGVSIKQEISWETEVHDTNLEFTQPKLINFGSNDDANSADDTWLSQPSEGFVKHESDEIEMTETELQPPDIYYDRPLANIGSSHYDVGSSDRIEVLPGAHEGTNTAGDRLHKSSMDREIIAVQPIGTKHPVKISKDVLKRKTHLLDDVKVRPGEKSFACFLCKHKTISKRFFEIHMRTHGLGNPYVFDVCNYKTAQKSSFKLHTRIHARGRSYHCPMCDYKAAQSSALKVHVRVHTGEKPYHCDICGYVAAQPSTLNAHVRIHTGETPYHCDMCGYVAAQRSALNSHMRIHTGEKLYH